MSEQYRTLTGCNMRQEPSTDAAIAATLKAGAIVHVKRVVDGWADVSVVNGWISAELLEEIKGNA